MDLFFAPHLIYFPAPFFYLVDAHLILSRYPFTFVFPIATYLSLPPLSTHCLPFPIVSKLTPDTHILHVFPSRVEAAGYQRILQVDLEVNGLTMTLGGREVTWQVEYPLTRTLTSEVLTLIRLAPQDLGGIVPLAMVRMWVVVFWKF